MMNDLLTRSSQTTVGGRVVVSIQYLKTAPGR
jgi:hypothetical protein